MKLVRLELKEVGRFVGTLRWNYVLCQHFLTYLIWIHRIAIDIDMSLQEVCRFLFYILNSCYMPKDLQRPLFSLLYSEVQTRECGDSAGACNQETQSGGPEHRHFRDCGQWCGMFGVAWAFNACGICLPELPTILFTPINSIPCRCP